MNGVLLGVLAYVAIQLAIGFLVSRRVATSQDYLVAGRRIGLGLGTFSMFATWFGAETCISAAGRFYAHGLAGGVTDPFGYTLALLLMGLVLAAPLWRRRLTTLADLFRQRYGPGVERCAAVIMIPTSVFWAAGQIRAFGSILHATSDLSLLVAISLATAVVLLYTCSGGLLADVVTDCLQGVVLILGLLGLLLVLCLQPDLSLGRLFQDVPSNRWDPLGLPDASPWEWIELWAVTILGSIVAQELAARALAARSPRIARNAALCGGSLYLVVGLIPAALGLIGPALVPGLDNPETFLPTLARQHLPALLHILFVGALVSAILSTVDSTLLAASSLFTSNVVVSFRPALSDRARLRLARVGVGAFGLVAWALAMASDSIHELVVQANGIGSAGILVLVLAGLFGRGYGGPRAAITALVLGLGVWAWGAWLPASLGGNWACPYLISLAAAVGGYLIVARIESPGPVPRDA